MAWIQPDHIRTELERLFKEEHPEAACPVITVEEAIPAYVRFDVKAGADAFEVRIPIDSMSALMSYVSDKHLKKVAQRIDPSA